MIEAAEINKVYYAVKSPDGKLSCGHKSRTNGLYESAARALSPIKSEIKRGNSYIARMREEMEYAERNGRDTSRFIKGISSAQEDISILEKYKAVKVKIVEVEE